MILNCFNLHKEFGDQLIVREGSFHIEEREKAALVGVNGAGKTTILRMIMGEIPLDDGVITLSKGKSIGYLSQLHKLGNHKTILEEVRSTRQDILELEDKIKQTEEQLNQNTDHNHSRLLHSYHNIMEEFERKNGYAYDSEVVGVLKGLGFHQDDFGKCTDTLSGGQKTRVALSKLLLSKPDLLLLDEPTNHLDLNSVAWLETFLMNYAGAVLIVSHDRYFLNRVVTKIIEVEHGLVRMYTGNYHDFAMKKQHIRDAMLKEYLNQQREIKRQEAVITKLKQFNREKSIKRAESREKLLDKMVVIDKPITEEQNMRFTLSPSIVSGNDVLSVEQLSKAFDDLMLFQDVSFEIKRGEHIAVIGDNGTGKTTLLKILNQVIPCDSGTFTIGSKVKIAYYDQEHHVLSDESTIFHEISDAYPNLSNTEIRNTLAAFQFTGDDVYKRIGDLSGGEKGRVSLAKMMLSEANFLIMDEPTNHLDIASKEILEQVIQDYTGTILYVSHDRYFINETATRILELKNNQFINYIGNYDYYLEKKDILQSLTVDASSKHVESEQVSSSKISWQEAKQEQAKSRKRANELSKVEENIHQLEARDQEIDQLLTTEEVYTNSVLCQELSKEKQDILMQLDELYAKWEELM